MNFIKSYYMYSQLKFKGQKLLLHMYIIMPHLPTYVPICDVIMYMHKILENV